jgi:hypothetical protein
VSVVHVSKTMGQARERVRAREPASRLECCNSVDYRRFWFLRCNSVDYIRFWFLPACLIFHLGRSSMQCHLFVVFVFLTLIQFFSQSQVYFGQHGCSRRNLTIFANLFTGRGRHANFRHGNTRLQQTIPQ